MSDKADKLLLVSATSLGTVRSYYGFLPLTPPTALISLTGQLVDLSTNKLEWYEKVENRNPATGEWDQAPEYENLMGAVDEGTRAATSQLRGAFFMERATPAAPRVAGTAAAGSAQ